MNSNRMWAAVLAGLLALSSAAVALDLGDDAPPLKVEKWVKGGPVDLKAGKDKTVYVVEFWATWCPPCRKSIPHLTEVQKKYKDKGVVVVGVSVDSGKGPRATRDKVGSFVEDQGDKMEYAIALDTTDQDTAKAYMEPFMLDGIPSAFIIDKAGKLAFVGAGFPMEGFDKALDDILAGKYDLKAAQKADKERRAAIENAEKAQAALEKYFELANDEDTKAKDLEKAGNDALGLLGKNAEMLNEFAWRILTDEDISHRDVKFALKVAKAAYDACDGKNAAIVDTYARALWDNGQKKEAIDYQKKAVELGSEDEQAAAELKATLRKYEKELKQGGDKPEKKPAKDKKPEKDNDDKD